ncbi:hypothetical protein BJ875DRAFT_525632 [Amylocarpus encephaloides]|uniref:Uncharacterized protein n=1 Tax=Amylocarpus encephaloides TaxID=45428 RepID=A0A9P7Y7X4_9HELO|nr:hypothetical protein BJ875DRAFT_525632 [Amylocarpus encephaloides]
MWHTSSSRSLALLALNCSLWGRTNAIAAPQVLETSAIPASSTSVSATPSPTPSSPLPDPRDMDEIKCWSSSYSYSLASVAVDDVARTIPYTSNGFISTLVKTDCCYGYQPIQSTTTLCDGYPRVLHPQEIIYNVTKTSTLYNITQTTRQEPPHTEVTPTCRVDNEAGACTRLWEAFDYTSLSLKKNADTRWSYGAYARPPCTSPIKACPTATQCSVHYDEVKMYYWPQTTVSGDFCAHNGTTFTPTRTEEDEPNTTEIDGMTFTSPSAYIVANSAFGWYKTSGHGLISYGKFCGHVETSATFTIAPEYISTIYVHERDTLYPMDWEDLNTIRHEAYQRACGRRYGCSSFSDIVSDFTPLVVIPDEVRTVESGWRICDGQGSFRPQFIKLGDDPDPEEDGDDAENDGGDDRKKKGKGPKAPATNLRAQVTSTTTFGTYNPAVTTTQKNMKHLEFEEEVSVIVIDGQPEPAEYKVL